MLYYAVLCVGFRLCIHRLNDLQASKQTAHRICVCVCTEANDSNNKQNGIYTYQTITTTPEYIPQSKEKIYRKTKHPEIKAVGSKLGLNKCTHSVDTTVLSNFSHIFSSSSYMAIFFMYVLGVCRDACECERYPFFRQLAFYQFTLPAPAKRKSMFRGVCLLLLYNGLLREPKEKAATKPRKTN